jgi:8-oxo-dGTP pyrophosphatase MutT (NUDIX family)
LRIAGVRETYEEAGILLVRDASGQPFTDLDMARRSRKSVADNELTLLDLVRTLDVRVDLGALTCFARWITPDIAPKRFDAWFFLARASFGAQIPLEDGRETVDPSGSSRRRRFDWPRREIAKLSSRRA